MPQVVIICSTLIGCLMIIVIIITYITCKHSKSSQHHNTNDEYLQISPKVMLHQTPDILYSHSHSISSEMPPPPPPPNTNNHISQSNHHHHPPDNKLVWTVPICTSSVKSDIYSDHENYSYLRGPSYDNYAKIDPVTMSDNVHTTNYYSHRHNHHHHHNQVDLDETSPGTHV